MTALFVLAWLIGAIATGIVAYKKGRSFWHWLLLYALLPIVALPWAILMSADGAALENRKLQNGDMKKCPQCAELIKAEAVRCRFCQSTVDQHVLAVDAVTKPEIGAPSLVMTWVLLGSVGVFVLIALGVMATSPGAIFGPSYIVNNR